MADRTRIRFACVVSIFAVLLFFVGLEIFSYFYYLIVDGQWKEIEKKPNYFYRKSDVPGLGYELKPDVNYDDGKNKCQINFSGMRDSEEPIANAYKIAFLGDSVAYGMGLDQKKVSTEILKKIMKEKHKGVQILNLGVPGYNLNQITIRFLREDGLYHFDRAVYLLNLNDFSRINSVYEGADNGLYRMYNPPVLKSIYFIRKVFYRWMKRDMVGWYYWLFQGNWESSKKVLDQLIAYTRDKKIPLDVFILPSKSGYKNEHYVLHNVTDRIKSYFNSQKINCVDLANYFSEEPTELIDGTDHLTEKGHARLANILVKCLL